MKRMHVCKIKGKLNRGVAVVGLLFFLFVLSVRKGNAGEDWLRFITAQILPVPTGSAVLGSNSLYEADYPLSAAFPEKDTKETWAAETEGRQTAAEQTGQTQPVEPVSDQGITYTAEQLADRAFLTSRIFTIDSNTSMTDAELNAQALSETDLTIPDLCDAQGGYKILIYHTHGSEAFADSRPGRTEDTVIGVGAYLAQLLEQQYGIRVYHDTTVYDVIDGKLDRNRAYEAAAQNVSKILQENPSIQVVIDLHRDGVEEELHLVTDVGGKPTAKIMFLNGVSRSNLNGEIAYLKNDNRQANLAFSFQLCMAGREAYGDYVRKIYVKSLRFNLHLMPRATLIEAGAQNNTVQEEKNAMEPLAAILYKVLSKEP